MNNDMISLAERCEAATGGDRELFKDVWREVFPRPARTWVTDNASEWTPEYTDWQELQDRFYELLDAEAWLDAAMTLVPDGWVWSMNTFAEPNRSASAYLMNASDEIIRTIKQYIATPALALCAASLRARALSTVSRGEVIE